MHTLAVRQLIKDRETRKAYDTTLAYKDSTIQALELRLLRLDSIRIQYQAQKLFLSGIESLNAQKEGMYKEKISSQQADLKRRKFGIGLAWGFGGVLLGLLLSVFIK
jgi:hypothetical protein